MLPATPVFDYPSATEDHLRLRLGAGGGGVWRWCLVDDDRSNGMSCRCPRWRSGAPRPVALAAGGGDAISRPTAGGSRWNDRIPSGWHVLLREGGFRIEVSGASSTRLLRIRREACHRSAAVAAGDPCGRRSEWGRSMSVQRVFRAHWAGQTARPGAGRADPLATRSAVRSHLPPFGLRPVHGDACLSSLVAQRRRARARWRSPVVDCDARRCSGGTDSVGSPRWCSRS